MMLYKPHILFQVKTESLFQKSKTLYITLIFIKS